MSAIQDVGLSCIQWRAINCQAMSPVAAARCRPTLKWTSVLLRRFPARSVGTRNEVYRREGPGRLVWSIYKPFENNFC